MRSSSAAHTLPLWPLPLLCALIPLLEWHPGLSLTAMFLVMASAWRTARLRVIP